jgi:hypothetical protein
MKEYERRGEERGKEEGSERKKTKEEIDRNKS